MGSHGPQLCQHLQPWRGVVGVVSFASDPLNSSEVYSPVVMYPAFKPGDQVRPPFLKPLSSFTSSQEEIALMITRSLFYKPFFNHPVPIRFLAFTSILSLSETWTLGAMCVSCNL